MITLAFTSVEKKIIVIDVAHGGEDHGAVLDNYIEKEITLNIAKKIKELNKNTNVEIVLTRTSDTSLYMNERVQKMNALNPDFVISLHVNMSKNEGINGIEIFISDENNQQRKSEQLATDLLNSFKDKKVIIKKSNFHILKNVNFPIALIELGYLTNEIDRSILTSEEGQTELANLILKVIK
jgi:N-acetylmuramoyl-L-alanine amidase